MNSLREGGIVSGMPEQERHNTLGEVRVEVSLKDTKALAVLRREMQVSERCEEECRNENARW